MGQKVVSLDKGIVNPGSHRMAIDASQLKPGIYFYTVRIGAETYTHKMVVE